MLGSVEGSAGSGSTTLCRSNHWSKNFGAVIQTGRQAGNPTQVNTTRPHVYIHTGRQAGKQTGKQTDWRTETDRQTGRSDGA